jgi:hypothetical protein
MLSFLVALAFAPVLLGLVWIYTSPLRRLDGYSAVKVIIRIVLFVAIIGVGVVQLAFLAHSVPLSARHLYAIPLLAIEGIPLTILVIYRDPRRRRSKSANPTVNEGNKDSGN